MSQTINDLAREVFRDQEAIRELELRVCTNLQKVKNGLWGMIPLQLQSLLYDPLSVAVNNGEGRVCVTIPPHHLDGRVDQDFGLERLKPSWRKFYSALEQYFDLQFSVSGGDPAHGELVNPEVRLTLSWK